MCAPPPADDATSTPRDDTAAASHPRPDRHLRPMPARCRVGAALAVLCLALVGWPLLHRGAPELLGELPLAGASQILGIRGSDVLIQSYETVPGGAGEDEVVAWSIATKRTRRLAVIEHHAAHLNRCWLTSRGVYAMILRSALREGRPAPPSALGPIDGAAPVAGLLAPPNGSAPLKADILEVPLDGAAPRGVCRGLSCSAASAVTVTDDAVYWVRPRAQPLPVPRPSPALPLAARPPIGDLVAQPLAGGPPRVCVRGIPAWTTLRAVGGAVAWDSSSNTATVLDGRGAGVPLGPASWGARPARLGSRWIWICPGAAAASAALPGLPHTYRPGPQSLMASAADGSDRHEIASELPDGKSAWVPNTLAVHRNAIYLVMIDDRQTPSLWRMTPGRDRQFDRVAALPGPWFATNSGFIDGSYYHLVVQRQRDTAPAWSTGPSSLVASYELYRWRLPSD